ncbi:MAG: ABC transporter substrate-binding protein [Proteobacteria bacterium]|nr:ABC transporter substrate-binding protein [Pseudomonadota bacterium]
MYGKVLAIAGIAFAVSLGATDQGHARSKSLTLQVGSQVPSVSTLLLYVAEKAGFLAKEDLDFDVRYTANAPTAMQLVAAGNADVGVLTVEPLILGYDKGLRGKMFYVHQRPLNYYIAVPESSQVRSLADLKGKNIGVSNLGSAAVPVVKSMMRTVGAEAGRDYTLVPVGVLDQAAAALKSDRVAAVALWESQYAAFARIGVPFRYFHHPTLGDFGNNGFAASDRTIKNKPDALCSLGRSLTKAIIFVRENPAAALKIYWSVNPGAHEAGDPAAAEAKGMREIDYIVKGYRTYTDGQKDFGEVDRAGLEKYMQMYKNEGALKEVPPVDDLVTDQFVKCSNEVDPAAVRKLAHDWKQ